jgi:hypothetical protein
MHIHGIKTKPYCMLKKTSRLIFWISLIFLAISLWTITIGQTLNYEFRNIKFASNFYNIIFTWTPFTVLLTLFGTIKKRHEVIRKILTVITTAGVTLFTFLFLIGNMFTIGFGLWATTNIAYENKENVQRQIREQQYDAGALGYGNRRIVEVEPFACLFYKVTAIDTAKIDKTQWRLVNKEGSLKFP